MSTLSKIKKQVGWEEELDCKRNDLMTPYLLKKIFSYVRSKYSPKCVKEIIELSNNVGNASNFVKKDGTHLEWPIDGNPIVEKWDEKYCEMFGYDTNDYLESFYLFLKAGCKPHFTTKYNKERKRDYEIERLIIIKNLALKKEPEEWRNAEKLKKKFHLNVEEHGLAGGGGSRGMKFSVKDDDYFVVYRAEENITLEGMELLEDFDDIHQGEPGAQYLNWNRGYLPGGGDGDDEAPPTVVQPNFVGSHANKVAHLLKNSSFDEFFKDDKIKVISYDRNIEEWFYVRDRYLSALIHPFYDLFSQKEHKEKYLDPYKDSLKAMTGGGTYGIKGFDVDSHDGNTIREAVTSGDLSNPSRSVEIEKMIRKIILEPIESLESAKENKSLSCTLEEDIGGFPSSIEHSEKNMDDWCCDPVIDGDDCKANIGSEYEESAMSDKKVDIILESILILTKEIEVALKEELDMGSIAKDLPGRYGGQSGGGSQNTPQTKTTNREVSAGPFCDASWPNSLGSARGISPEYRVSDNIRHAWAWLSPFLSNSVAVSSGQRTRKKQMGELIKYYKAQINTNIPDGVKPFYDSMKDDDKVPTNLRAKIEKMSDDLKAKKVYVLTPWKSLHVTSSNAFDIAGGDIKIINNIVKNIEKEAGSSLNLGVLLEPNNGRNGVVHINVIKASEPSQNKIDKIWKKIVDCRKPKKS